MVVTFQSLDKVVNVTFQKKITERYFGTVLYYRKWSFKRRGAYFTYGWNIEGNIERITRGDAQFNINYIFLTLLYEPSFIVPLHQLAKVLTNTRTNEGVTFAFSVRFKRIVHFTSNSLKSDKNDHQTNVMVHKRQLVLCKLRDWSVTKKYRKGQTLGKDLVPVTQALDSAIQRISIRETNCANH